MTNNAGAAGGALTDRHGRLAAVLGKELRSSLDNTWLNYALPISEVAASIQDIIAGKLPSATDVETADKPDEPLSLDRLGLVLVPDILEKTPPFVDATRLGSAAEKAGLRPDDLLVFVGDRMVQSRREVSEMLSQIDRDDTVKVTILRGQELLNVVLQAER